MKVMRHNIKYSAALLVVMPLLCALFASCTDDIDLKLEQQKSGFTIVGDPVDVSLSIAVSDLTVDVSTRAEEPTDDFDPEDTEAERHVDDLWIFEYDKASGDLIYMPQYVTIKESQQELENVQVTLSNNYGKSVVLYVVANSGSGLEDSSKGWVVYNSTTETYDGFMTLDELKKATIPTPHPQRMVWDEATETYVIHDDDASIVGNISIPMGGSVGEDGTTSVTISDGAEILIPVERMFAKVIVRVDLSDFNTEGDYSSAWLNTLSIGNIPEYGTVGTLWDGDKGDTAQKADYSGCSQWLQRRFNALGESSSDTDSSDPSDVIYPYLIYVPENIQGENQVDESTDKAKNIPASIRGQYGTYDTDALSVTAGIYVQTQGGSTLGEYNTFIAYPGGNETTNFNVRRNCVYRVTLKINDIIDPLIPSANCIVCLSGETTAFYPYCREETGGGYKFEDYLDAYDVTDEESEDSKKIDHVRIIWQSTDSNEGSGTGYIGNNSDGKLVWIDDLEKEEAEDEYHRRIHVTIPSGKTGNALVGAYNKAGVIIWSWHIWSRLPENDPTTVNTKLYYTYEWDENGIYGKDSGRPRVAGYTIMNCNLGAMADEPNGDVSYARYVYHTFGTLYQWGRKDPFPPAMPTGTQQNTTINYGEYNSTNVYSYYDNADKEVTIVGTNTSTALFHSVPGTERKEASEAILNAIHNPTVFYASTKEVNQATYEYTGYNNAESALQNNYSEPQDGNWMLDSEGEHYNRLWGGLDPEQDVEQITKTYKTNLTCLLGDVHLYDDYGEKSIFDPCPYGWRVSPPDLWLGFTDTGLNPGTTFTTEHYNYNTNSKATGSCGVTLYLTGWLEGESSFFPSQGVRAPDGSILRMGACGNYNNATADAGDRVNILHTHYDFSGTSNFHIFEVTYLPYYVKGSANSIRCVRIASVEQ